jgi:hypothetical protein
MRVLAYGIPTNYTDEYLHIGEDTTIELVRRFCNVLICEFGPTYLRDPYEEGMVKLMSRNAARGWLGMLGSIIVCTGVGKIVRRHGMKQYCGKSHDPTIAPEVVASQDLWIWHCFFELPGSQRHQCVAKVSSICPSC